MAETIFVEYPDDELGSESLTQTYILQNFASLRNKLLPNKERDSDMISYVFDLFDEDGDDEDDLSPGQKYEINRMLNYPFFAHKVLDDFEKTDEEKHDIYLDSLTQSDNSEGKVALVDGAMGGGKTGFLCWTLDEYHKRKPNLKYFFVTKSDTKPLLPKWITIVKDIMEVESYCAKYKIGCVAGVDEGAISLNARRAMSGENISASEFLVKLRQKGITLIILVQDIFLVDKNVRRVTQIRILKFGISFGTESKKNGESTNEDLQLIRQRLKPHDKTEAYIEISSQRNYIKFKHGLPSWFDSEKTSKYMKDWVSSKQKKQVEIKKIIELNNLSGIE